MSPRSRVADLPDPFLRADRTRVSEPGEWPAHREHLRETMIGLAYGGMPPAPAAVRYEDLHRATVRSPYRAEFFSFRVVVETEEAPFAFALTLTLPPASERPARCPVVLTGDACWRYATEEIIAEIFRRGYILAQFNRTEFAIDTGNPARTAGIYPLFPGQEFGALSAWAWGYHRAVDALAGMDFVDAARIAVVGHSRGGKASLLAGATDERIALTAANGSGCAGAGSHRWRGEGAEDLAAIFKLFPFWFGPRLGDYAGREDALPFDQHFLTALVAPRALLITEAFGDLWANPTGTWQVHRATREVYRFLGVEKRVGIAYREGRHEHNVTDWRTFLGFADAQFAGRSAAEVIDPFPGLPPAFAWTGERA